MPASCVILDCNLKYTHSEDVSFHRFPLKNMELLKQWILFTGRAENWRPTKWSAICSRHFVASDFKDCPFRKILLPFAIPSVRTLASKVHAGDLTEPLPYETVWSEEERPIVRNEDYLPMTYDFDNISANATLCPIASSDCGEEIGVDSDYIQLVEITCRICGVVFSRSEDNLLTDLVQSLDVVRKYLPFVNLDLPNLPGKICLNCSKVVNGFSKFSDNVLRAQSDLEHRFALQSVSTLSKQLPVARSHPETTSAKSMNIKQEPITSINIKEEKIEYAINGVRQKECLASEAVEGTMIIKNQAFGTDPNRFYLFKNMGQDLSNRSTSSPLMKQQNRESSKNCEILEIVNLYPPIVDITSTTVTEVQPYEITLPSVTTTSTSEPLPSVSSYSASTEQFVGSLKVENTTELETDLDQEYYLPDKLVYLNTLEEHSYTKLPIQADDNKDEIFHNMIVVTEQRIETTNVPAAKKDQSTSKKKKTRWTCSCCDITFHRQRRLLAHRELECPGRRKLSTGCRFCPQKFPSWQRLRAHVCFCLKRAMKRKRFELKAVLEKLRQHGAISGSECTPNQEEVVITKYPCSMCDRTYSNASNLRRHLNSHRPQDQWNHKCGVCFKIFDKLYDLKKHIQISPCSNGGNTAIMEDGRVEGPSQDQNHAECSDGSDTVITSSPNTVAERLLYVCSTCYKVFQSYNSLKVHEPIHTGLKAYICETCGKRFSGRSNLWQHRLTHSELRQYGCMLCSKVFKRKGGLSQHVRSIHMKIKPYQCTTCSHEYALKADMTRCRHSRLYDSTTPAC
ncbi:zinc finger protein 583-like [Anopheles nili]|uniref:zinc finger protein 583-like n=1 Tax=Anopheles nili TaxID=185578 RepID=UPI00237B9E50|nr:zinc finger protein 583-like [Anopheles nili]